ncbi:ABC transporter ATP-binding protein [bacterium]|nr:ABC transporter ATP-binding protein [bacterium]
MAGKVSVTNLTKSFPIGRRPGLRERLAGKGRKRDRRKILNGISFEVTPGEVIGIIGRNGAGKSTLLKLLAGIYSSDDGKIVTQGRIASLLELGAGFHPELTGMENIRLNGSLLGMSGKEIDRKEKMILDFAELEAFAEDQIKTYSAGMILRLAFSVAMALDPDIFLLDEIIGVGDLAFQRKCFSRISELKSEGKTILFVSHNLSIMRFFAEKIMWIEDGRVEGFGNKHQVLDRYRERLSSSGGDVSRMDGGGDGLGMDHSLLTG